MANTRVLDESGGKAIAEQVKRVKGTAEEASSSASSAKLVAEQAKQGADDAKASVLEASAKAQTAKETAEAAAATAGEAKTTAEAAQDAADTAQSTADTAQQTAEAAQAAASQASAAVEKAQTAATAAQSAADTAQSAADAAQSAVEKANAAIDEVKQTAADAKKAAESAQSTADTAKANAATAQSAAEAAQKTATDAKTAEEKHESNEDVHITAEEREKWNAAYEETILEYGVRFPLNASSPAGERVKRQGGEIQTWDIEYTPNVGSVTDNPFESIKLFNPELFTDSAGNVFRSFSRFYVAIERTGEYLYYWVCEKQANDKYHLPRAFYKNGSPYWNHVDIGVYEGGQETQSDATCLNSKSGQTLWTNQTRTAAYEGAKAWHKHLSVDTSRECYMITQLSEITEILQPLLLIMFGTRHSQSVYNGVVSASNYVQTGQTDSISALCGTTSNGGTASFKALGIENIWGNVYKRVLDLTMKARTPWICENLDKWTDVDPATNPAFKEVSLELPASGWITDIEQATDHPDVVLPTAASGGSSSTYYPDYVYASTSGPYTAYFGGYCNDGGSAGLFFWYLGSSLTYVYSLIGARLSHRRL